jgi:hypothetical protein
MPGRWPAEASLLATARHPVMRARTPAGPARAWCRPGADRSGTSPVPGWTPDHRGISAVAGVPAPARRSGRAESGTAPPCMRWRGRARPRRPGWPVAWSSPSAAPPAGARYPREGPVSRLLPRSRRRPRVVPVSSGKSIITTAASTAQDPAASHFLFFRYPRKAPQRAGSYPHSTAVIHGLFTTYPQVPGYQPENTTTAGAECPVLCNQLAT